MGKEALPEVHAFCGLSVYFFWRNESFVRIVIWESLKKKWSFEIPNCHLDGTLWMGVLRNRSVKIHGVSLPGENTFLSSLS